ncbi:MAG: 3-oxoacyl-ACP synthase [Flavobacterium sp.]|nr:MAG: 3-oxoacyl-ACP synthase [Flavobacterium sp.]
MGKYFINGIGNVSAQETTDSEKRLQDFEELKENLVSLQKPDFKKYIQPSMIRRMSVGVKMGVVASSIALQEAGIEIPEAIITGSGMGCLRDSEKFLKNIVDNDEQFLTPTAFIQSTHNTVGAQIALGLGCKNYNVTYVHDATSFETSLTDAMMMMDEGDKNVLVGGVDEIGPYTASLHDLIGHVKPEESLIEGILNSKTKGAVYSEGTQFFVLEDYKNEKSYAQLVDVFTYNELPETEIETTLEQFLKNNNLLFLDLDLVVLGNNGDVEFDSIYNNLQEGILKNTSQIYYKHLSGEYNTASAFGMWTACKLIKEQEIPENLRLNSVEVNSIKNVLLYNQYRGKNHSFVLLKSC